MNELDHHERRGREVDVGDLHAGSDCLSSSRFATDLVALQLLRSLTKVSRSADTPSMSARFGLTIGLTIAAVAFGGWRLLIPGGDNASSDVASGVSAMLATTLKAQFVGAQASLDAQRQATGSYAGALVQPPVTLVRADVSSYCLQLEDGAVSQHLAGPGGAPQPGRC